MIIRKNYLKKLGLLAIWSGLSLVLTACQVYDSYPVATPEPTVPVTVVIPTNAPRPTLPPPPTVTPRPTLPPVPGNLQLQKTAILKDGFDRIITYYYHQLSSADIYEVGLRSIQEGLVQNGIAQPDVPIPDFGDQASDNWNKFSQAYSLVAAKYQGQVSEDNLEQFALQGTLASFRDCQSEFITSDAANSYAAQRLSTTQGLVGIGINFLGSNQNGQNVFVLTRVIKGGPAEKAGLKLGDQIVAIDGQNLDSLEQTRVAELIRGRAAGESEDKSLGTKVSLTVRRAGSGPDQTVSLTRARVQIPFMEHQVLNNIGYLRINYLPILSNQTDLDNNTKIMASWLAEFDQAHVTGIVIDLRDNTNGSIRLVQNFLSYFLSGDSLLYLQGSQAGQNGARDYTIIPMPSSQTITKIDTPLAVLVNGNTRAEAELFAYAIQHNKRGTIVGDPTAGCMAASNPTALKDNSVINLMIYRAVLDQTSSDKLVPAIEPEQKVELDTAQLLQGHDAQLDAAVKVLTK